MFYQSSPAEIGQLMGITKHTFAWEVFYESLLYTITNFWCVHNEILEHACPV